MSPEQWEYVNDAKDFFSQQYVIVTIDVLAAVALTYVVWKLWPKKIIVAVPGEGTMKRAEYLLSKREKKQQENNTMADAVEEMLLTLFTKGVITQERYEYWHARFGTQLNLKDLLPGKMTAAQVKQAAKTRLANGVYKPVPFPKEERKIRPKNIVDRLLHSL